MTTPIRGVALTPGVSANGRLYTPETIAKAVRRAQQRIRAGVEPITMMSHHGAEDDSTRIVGRVTSMTQAPDGSAHFDAELADTKHGKTIARLVDPKSRFLRGVSIRGAWAGPVRSVTVGAQEATTSDDLEICGLDFTKSPGVAGALLESADPATGICEKVTASMTPGNLAGLSADELRAALAVTEAVRFGGEVREAGPLGVGQSAGTGGVPAASAADAVQQMPGFTPGPEIGPLDQLSFTQFQDACCALVTAHQSSGNQNSPFWRVRSGG